MPEGDTIEALARRINDRFAGQRVERSVVRDPRLVGVDLAGSTLVDAVAVGKHLLIRFDDGTTLHSHLRLDGRWEVGRAAREPEWQRRVELSLSNGRLTGVNLPTLGLVATADEHTVVGHLGPDVCAPEPPDVDDLAARLRTAGDAPLAQALLDQTLIAGFGNVFAIELPFLVGLSPFHPIARIPSIDGVIRVGVALIRWSMQGSPRNTTGRQLRRADHWVYDRAGGRCPRCGTRLRQLDADSTPWQRWTIWCPTCQPDDAADADIALARRLLALHPARRDALFPASDRPA